MFYYELFLMVIIMHDKFTLFNWKMERQHKKTVQLKDYYGSGLG
jgi:hypothetical protein